jgi:DNA-binding transcriptional MerR regulator
MVASRQWTLSEAARLLRQPQHRLIYLCEKEAVVPDFADAHGRGSSRRFSSRNLLEFSVALRLRSLDLSVGAIKAILHTLRSFERTVRKEIPGFDIVDDLRRARAPDLRVLVAEGPRVYFSLGARGEEARLFGGIELAKQTKASPRLRVSELARGTVSPPMPTKVEVNVTEVAKALDLDG